MSHTRVAAIQLFSDAIHTETKFAYIRRERFGCGLFAFESKNKNKQF